MDNITKILEQFHYFNIDSELDSVYGNWAVTKKGDVVNYLYPYAILTKNLNDCDWVAELSKRVWFRPECEAPLEMALKRAKVILSKK